jgi:30S ribosomal protein S31
MGFGRKAASERVLDLPPFARDANLISEQIQEHQMGKGDRKTAKGKRYNSSYGNARSKATTKAAGTPAAPVKKTVTRTATATKAPAKKAVVRKTAAKE